MTDFFFQIQYINKFVKWYAINSLIWLSHKMLNCNVVLVVLVTSYIYNFS